MNKLDAPTQSRLRSTQILTSLSQVVSELLQNALDAGATMIEIGLDAQEWMCWMKDNGHGISKNDLEVIAREGDSGRYVTSKAYAQNLMNAESTFGFRGEALASAAELSCLEISSRMAKSKESWSSIVKGGKRLYFGPSVRWRKDTAGTVVCIRDAFYNLPVRRLSHPTPTKTWDLVCQEVERYALVSPEVTFTIEDVHGSKAVSPNDERIIRIPKTPSMLAAFRRLYGHSLVQNVEEIRVSREPLGIQGFISLAASHSKNHQYIYINRHPLETSDLHTVVNSCFSQSTFGRTALSEDGARDLPGAEGIRRSPRKAEKRPIYALNICIPPNDIDNCLEPSKNSLQLKHRTPVSRLLSSTIDAFLRKHGFILDTRRQVDRAYPFPRNPDIPKKRRRIECFDDSGFIEADVFGQSTKSSDYQRLADSEESTSSELFISVDGESTRTPWTDPNTGERFIIDTQTGNSLGSIEQPRLAMKSEPASRSSVNGGLNRRIMKPRGGAKALKGSYDVPDWLSRALDANQAYPAVEQRLSLPSTGFPPWSTREIESLGCSLSPLNQLFSEDRTDLPGQFSRQQLHGARVIAQVDKKFIACLLTSECSGESMDPERVSSTLVLVDQHAADERIRVEGFLRPLCLGFLYSQSGGMGPGEATLITRLTPPRPILLAKHEASLLRVNKDVQALFQDWGISILEISEKGVGGASDIGSSEYVQVLVNSLPEVVSDKLLQNTELQELIKNTIGQIQSGTLTLNSTSPPLYHMADTNHDWLPALRHCPRSLVELINSKACRGAVMFNDELTKEQCQRLISQLTRTAFPFQCAHGRPSLIPVTNVNPLARASSQSQRLCDWKKFEQ